ncbi:MAG: M3 family oligoendopeptidase [Promethearchaeota archaeon]
MTEKEISWDLTEIFSSPNDPKLFKTMENLMKRAEELVKKYKGKINLPNFIAQNLLELFQETEELWSTVEELEVFSENSFNANMTLPETQSLNNKFQEFETDISKKLAFIELEVGKYVYENEKIISNPILANYKHLLKKIRREFPHKLSEIEEQLILEKDQFGVKAWSQLQATWLNTRKFKVLVEGEEKELSYGEADSLIKHPDRATRISANKSIYGLLGKDEDIFSSALRNICGNWVKNSKRRKFNNPMHASFIANDTNQEIIDNLMKTIELNANVYQRYLKIKADILNLSKLTCADVRAPLPGLTEKQYGWDKTKELILEAYSKFDSTFEGYVKDMFKRNHIDASIRIGKRNGAYCSPWFSGKSAYILLSFTGKMNEIYSLAHEFGHAIHSYLSSEEQTYFNYHPGASVAETASIFGELLMTDLLLSKAELKEEKIAILAHVLDEAGQAAFQVSARVWFEQSLYDAIEKGENLNGKTISKYWCAGRDKIYGDSVEWFDELIWEWTMKSHYYMPNFRFYNYPYVYAQLFVYALYQVYKKEGKDFVPKFKKLLREGGSLSPEELAKIVGLDITKPDFWKLGIKQYEDFVNQLEKLTK